MEKIDWIKVNDLLFNKMVKGKIYSASINNQKLFLVKKENEVIVGDSKCPHAKGNLAIGFLTEKDEIVCPLHRFKFSLKTGRSTDNNGLCVEVFPSKLENNKILVGFKKRGWFW